MAGATITSEKHATHAALSAGIASSSTFTPVEDVALAAGYDTSLLRHWRTDTVAYTHADSFDAEGLVIEDEMCVTCVAATPSISHADRFMQGATVRMARPA